MLAFAIVLPTIAGALSPSSVISRLDRLRVANGIPGQIQESGKLSAACAAHNRYERLNGKRLYADEVAGKRGYSKAGKHAAAGSALAFGTGWPSSTPFRHAPIHFAQLLDPRLKTMGVDVSRGFICATTLFGRDRPAPTEVRIHVFPGKGKLVPASELAKERPFTPGEKIGIPQGTTTGPYLYLFVDGPWGRNARVRLTAAGLLGVSAGNHSRVTVKRIDNKTPGLNNYLPTGGILIPVKPLKSGASYFAAVKGKVYDYKLKTPRNFSYSWKFTTR